MKYTIHLFGITRDIIGANTTEVELLNSGSTVEQLLGKLKQDFPKLQEIKSLVIAVNSEYAEQDLALSERDEIALIPPVSGG
ncbi:MAG: MoaD/ThiS family protein [Arcicella sp.]|jgi:molybdopterin synthase sulfur carrier subunit|nr:MoaD/ThiS family protein [Arcicella sp.]